MKEWLTTGLLLALSGCGAAPTIRVIAEGASPDLSDTHASRVSRPARGEELSLPIDCPDNLGAARVWLGLRSKKVELKIECAVPLPGANEPTADETARGASSASSSETHTITFEGVLPRRGSGVVESLRCPQDGGFIEVRINLNKDDYHGTARCEAGGK